MDPTALGLIPHQQHTTQRQGSTRHDTILFYVLTGRLQCEFGKFAEESGQLYIGWCESEWNTTGVTGCTRWQPHYHAGYLTVNITVEVPDFMSNMAPKVADMLEGGGV